jgi:hypothetical protein
MGARLAVDVVSIVRRLRARGGKLSAIASSVGHSTSGVHRYVRDVACPINHQSMALRRQVTTARRERSLEP